MDIPFDIKIFSLIYESGKYLLPLLFVLWLTWLICVTILRKKKQFLCTSAAFLLFCMLGAAFTWCGWHYRMELRDRFARDKTGWSDPYTGYPINLNVMPPEILAEYAKHDYHPRFRDMKAMFFGTIVLTPFLFALGGLSFLIIVLIRKLSRINMPKKE